MNKSFDRLRNPPTILNMLYLLHLAPVSPTVSPSSVVFIQVITFLALSILLLPCTFVLQYFCMFELFDAEGNLFYPQMEEDSLKHKKVWQLALF